MFGTEPPRARTTRSDGEQSRERLMVSALRLFAQQGYAKTSTREIAEAAGANLAAISYYFGDKAGLYRTVFTELRGLSREAAAQLARPGQTLHGALRGYYEGYVEPLRQGDLASLCMRLHLREMLEPTGLWDDEVREGIQPVHDALVAMLCRAFGLRRADDEVQRLAVCIAALGVHLHVGREVTEVLAPGLTGSARSLDLWLDRLVMYAEAMVDAERARRSEAGADRRRA